MEIFDIYLLCLKIGVAIFIFDIVLICTHCSTDGCFDYWDNALVEKVYMVTSVISMFLIIGLPVIYGLYLFFTL